MSNITRRDPLDDFFRGFRAPGGVRQAARRKTRSAADAVDVKGTENAYQVHAELPGIKKEDIHVHRWPGGVHQRRAQAGQRK